jgi:hypothetical protein
VNSREVLFLVSLLRKEKGHEKEALFFDITCQRRTRKKGKL